MEANYWKKKLLLSEYFGYGGSSGDIFVSIERVEDNAKDFNVPFDEELKRVLAHGVLHYCGYKDKSDEDALLMRTKEEEKIKLFHVEL